MERKYRQAGYMDRDREEKKHRPPKPQSPPEFRSRPMPGFHDVHRCALCGTKVLAADIGFESHCPKCRADLHSCKHCSFFDSGTRFECTQPILERILKKNARNQCTVFEMKKSVERETSSSSGQGGTVDARQAFHNLFKK